MNEDDRGPERRVVDGRFELETRLGGGGMGTVWRARDLVLHRLVAVKEVRPPDRDLAEYDPEGARLLRERVLREARALARIDHPNVVTIHHIVDGGEGTYPWIVMEMVSGGSLADRLAEGPMAPAEATRIGRQVLAALTAAHDAGIQHRDVKPANVLMRPDGRPVLTDFGIAAIRETSGLTATGSVIGTPDFMAPERISGHEGGSASDLWSLAMMLYTAVEGHHPLRRGSTLATLAAVLNDDVVPPVRAGALGDVLMSVLVRDPAARPSAAVFDQRLAEIEAGPASAGAALSEPTSFPLTPPTPATAPVSPYSGGFTSPGAFTPSDAAPTPPVGLGKSAGDPARATTAGFGPPPSPYQPSAGYLPHQRVTAPVGPPRPRGRRTGFVLSMTGVSLAGALLLLWWLLPHGDDGDSDAKGSPTGSPTASGTRSTPKSTSSPADADPTAERTKDTTEPGDMLTPDGIRTAIKAFKEETGRTTFGDFSVYPDFVSAQLMVKGSDKKYDSYTYRPGQGVEKGIIKGTLSGGEQPVDLDDFDWDKVPALLKEAEKKLNVPDPENRYLLVRQPNDIFDTPAGMAVYFSDEYSQSGYLEADPKGKVTRVYPAES
ncbi:MULTISPECIES: serine/threonine-protein kinase [Streptomyces]|uniref:non-specific serine/threonine protein kinase n=7 Tax=Streptomyces scabiei TaxID=1930 RepID=C9YVM6_STRSW|nr:MULTISPECIES: serine/threonine-protein kinase [Streptomyces]KFG10005.1 serine/threonine protein kinase [Streptomyces scabiei]MBP5889235.1 protein kinase [Streptomyces sp. LBUM 1481]MBP5919255.1 protein kinase [Streptomyces sp. LBUM 1483]MDX2540030.1 protein kinase [Streptomyces scabiei]MDX2577887.1 protein kinase [Streptomyces scabiei]